ncbi:MAG: CoA transferase [Xanthomonadales bacterium]|nr:CoA transferase [Xanthomonadales bacterium]
MGPLAGIRVLDLSRILAGPWATQLLADLGAEVIKVERPGSGDDTRRWGPPWLADGHGAATAESAYFLSANRGKRSVTLDFTQPAGADLVRALARQSQIVVENYKVGALARYGLDYASLIQLNPALVYCSITGYGQTGPYADRAGYDSAIQAQGGLMSITGEPDGTPGGGPQKVGVAVSDLMTGMYAVVGILAALRHSEATGQGQQIDLALLDSQVGWLANQAMNYLVGGQLPQRHGTAHPNIVPYQMMPSADGHFMLAVGNDAQFRKLCAAIGLPALAEDPRYRSNAERVIHRDALIDTLSLALRQQPTADWLREFESLGIPCAPVQTLDQVFADPQVQARGMRFELAHGSGVEVPMVANPLRFSETAVAYHRAPPQLGADTRAVLSERLGLDQAELDRLAESGVIAPR